MADEDYLFNNVDWFTVQENRKSSMMREIDSIESNRLLNTSADDLCDYFDKKFRIDVPVLERDGIVADQKETQIDVSHDPYRDIRDRGSAFHVPGTAVEITVPFSGDALAFSIRPTSFTSGPPRALVGDGSLIVRVAGTNLNAGGVRTEVDRTIGEIQRYLEWLRNDAEGLNKQLRQLARQRIDGRRDKLLKDQELVAGLEYPLKERSDAPKTYVAPEVRRRISPKMPKASNAPFKPEPILVMGDYEYILNVLTNMTIVMERSPSAFETMDEEALRTHFLVQLNGHYEGQATGETFNYEGKTDILIRVQGRNIFVAECKYWNGPKKLVDTLDQLLGYASWRDTKLAIVLFNRNRNFTKVLGAIPEAIRQHSCFKKELGQPTETSFRYSIGNRGDPNREMTLTVLAFDVPTT